MERGIKETTEVINFITTLGVLIGEEVAKDDLEFTDVFKLFDDQDFRIKISEALSGIKLVLAELNDLSLSESLTLSVLTIESFGKILASFEKEAA